MNWSNLPPLGALRAFAVLAETQSYTRAGRALNVTHGAVIQQVRALEERLGVTLVVREGRGVKLTQEGISLAHHLTLGFQSIRRGVEALTDADLERPVQVSMSPAFAVAWLMPRLPDFQQQHAGITLLLNPTAEVVELKPRRGRPCDPVQGPAPHERVPRDCPRRRHGRGRNALAGR